MLDTPELPPAVAARRPYDNQNARHRIKGGGRLPAIPNPGNAAKKPCGPRRIDRRRRNVEKVFCCSNHWRCITTRYDRPARYLVAAAALADALNGIKL